MHGSTLAGNLIQLALSMGEKKISDRVGPDWVEVDSVQLHSPRNVQDEYG